jgi:metal-responsive CopG/Arc/MetJ family transcriptional regulator
MKAIQITFDESLLEHLDEDEEVRKRGRSAVLRELVREFLDRKRAAAIDAQYRRGYADFDGLGPEFDGWEKMGAWPED